MGLPELLHGNIEVLLAGSFRRVSLPYEALSHADDLKYISGEKGDKGNSSAEGMRRCTVVNHTCYAQSTSPEPADQLAALLHAGSEPLQDGLMLLVGAAGRRCLHKLQRLGPMLFHVRPHSGNELQEKGRLSCACCQLSSTPFTSETVPAGEAWRYIRASSEGICSPPPRGPQK